VVFGLIAARISGAEDTALVFAALTVLTTVASLFLLSITAVQLNRAHDALEQARARTRELIELASDGIFVADLDGRFIDVNDAACRMVGYSREEIVGKPILDLIPPKDVERYWTSRAQFIEGGIHVAEWTLRLKDETLLSVEVSAKRLPHGRWQGIVRDISKRKRAEEALRLSEAKFSGIVSISADAIITIDDTQRIILFNEGAEKIFGCSSADMIGAPLDILIPERFRAVHWRHIKSFAAGADAARRMSERGGTVYGLRRNGEEFPADATISKLSIGGKSMLTVALRDITEQKRVESEQRLLAEAGSVLATTLDFENTLTNTARLVVGELADLCIIDIVEDDDKVRRARVVCRDPSNARLCDTLMRMPLERDKVRPSGWVREIGQPILVEQVTQNVLGAWALNEEHLRALQSIDPKSIIAVPLLVHGKFLGRLSLMCSSSSRKYGPRDLHMAEAIAQLAALSLESARLYRTSRRATQARDDVLGIVAHDLRNPLQIIVTMAARLRSRGPEPARQMGETIGDAANRMNRLIQDLLDVISMETGHLSLGLGQLGVAEVVSDSFKAQMPLASSKSLALQLALGPDLPDVWADRDRILQVFENLIGNAIKFTKPGGRITLSAEANAGEVVFSVSDTGAGVAQGDLPHLFDRFWQASKGTRRGAGLGLPIAKGIVEAHGGRIWVRSSPGQGSTFYFTIPTAPQASSAMQPNYGESTFSPARHA
jgi:PAS domain S-box-containing protein